MSPSGRTRSVKRTWPTRLLGKEKELVCLRGFIAARTVERMTTDAANVRRCTSGPMFCLPDVRWMNPYAGHRLRGVLAVPRWVADSSGGGATRPLDVLRNGSKVRTDSTSDVRESEELRLRSDGQNIVQESAVIHGPACNVDSCIRHPFRCVQRRFSHPVDVAYEVVRCRCFRVSPTDRTLQHVIRRCHT